MAIIMADTRCPICNNKLDKPYTVTSGVVFARTHPLWQFCDAPLHFDCLETWPSRIKFSEGYFNAVLQHYQTGSGGFLLIQEKDWLFATGPVGKICYRLGIGPLTKEAAIAYREILEECGEAVDLPESPSLDDALCSLRQRSQPVPHPSDNYRADRPNLVGS